MFRLKCPRVRAAGSLNWFKTSSCPTVFPDAPGDVFVDKPNSRKWSWLFRTLPVFGDEWVSIPGCHAAGSRGYHGDEFFLRSRCSDKFRACGFTPFPVAAGGVEEFVLEQRPIKTARIWDETWSWKERWREKQTSEHKINQINFILYDLFIIFIDYIHSLCFLFINLYLQKQCDCWALNQLAEAKTESFKLLLIAESKTVAKTYN